MADVVITVNSPGELLSWVAGTATEIKKRRPDLRVVVALVPCPFASGREMVVARELPGVDIVLSPGETAKAWFGAFPQRYRPAPEGVVLYLGGEPWHTLLLARPLGYAKLAYVVRDNNFWRYFDVLGLAADDLSEKLKRHPGVRLEHVGNMMVDAVASNVRAEELKCAADNGRDGAVTIGMFPGSRGIHLRVALGPFLRVAQLVRAQLPQSRFLLAASPFASREAVARALERPLDVGLATASGKLLGDRIVLDDGLEVSVIWGQPYRAMALLDVALTIPGTNTAELAACGRPMVVGVSSLVPFPRGGLGGLLDKLPLFSKFKRYLRLRSYRRHGYAALPNKVAGEMIVPEVLVEEDIGILTEPLLALAANPEQRQVSGARLQATMGNNEGAHGRMAALVCQELR